MPASRAGWLTQIRSHRWAGAEYVALLVFVPETYLPAVLKARAKKLRKAGRTDVRAPIEIDDRSIPRVLLTSCYRPFRAFVICNFKSRTSELTLAAIRRNPRARTDGAGPVHLDRHSPRHPVHVLLRVRHRISPVRLVRPSLCSAVPRIAPLTLHCPGTSARRKLSVSPTFPSDWASSSAGYAIPSGRATTVARRSSSVAGRRLKSTFARGCTASSCARFRSSGSHSRRTTTCIGSSRWCVIPSAQTDLFD